MSSAATSSSSSWLQQFRFSAFEQVLTEQSVGVLIGPSLPRRVRVREVDPHYGRSPLPPLLSMELRYALQCRDASPPPLDPSAVRILLRRLTGIPSLREAETPAVCESGGKQYDTMIRGLFRDLRRHLDRAWADYTGADPFAGDLWQVALLDLQPNASRHWLATKGVVDFDGIEAVWLREVVKDWARATRPHLQRLRQTLRACQTASTVLVAAGRCEPTELGAGDYTRIIAALRDSAAMTACCIRPRTATCWPTSSARSSTTAALPVCSPRCPTPSGRCAAAGQSSSRPTRTNSARRCPNR